MNRAPRQPDRPYRDGGRNRARSGRRNLFFTVTPIVATVLIVVAMAAVVVHTLNHGGARPTAFGETSVPGTADPAVPGLTTTPPPVTTTTPTTTRPTVHRPDPAIARAAVAAVDAMHVDGVEYGIAILDRVNGRLTVGDEGDVGFYSASVVKLFVVVDLLYQAEHGNATISSADRHDFTRMLELSDDNAMNSVWERHEGPALVTDLIHRAGLHDTVLDTANLGEWGETKISARDVTAVWNFALTKLSAADTKLVVNDTHSAANSGADGFYQAFGLLQPPRPSTVKAKQGWMIAGSTMILNTTGMIGPDNEYVVAILTKQSAGIGYSQGRANVNAASAHVRSILEKGLN